MQQRANVGAVNAEYAWLPGKIFNSYTDITLLLFAHISKLIKNISTSKEL